MISSEHFDPVADPLTDEAAHEGGDCPKCGGPMTWRQAHGYPVWTQIAFGASFIVFISIFDRIKLDPRLLWSWSVAQMLLGFLLITGRKRAKQRVLRCIRCSAALR